MIRAANYTFTLIIDPDNYAKKAQVGVDLTIKSLNKISSRYSYYGYISNDFSTNKTVIGKYEPVELVDTHLPHTGVYVLSEGIYSITFDQGLKPLPADNTAFIYHRSSLARNGVIIMSAVYDPGFETPNMGAIMTVNRPVMIENHARIAQIVVYTSEEISETYNGQYQGVKDIR